MNYDPDAHPTRYGGELIENKMSMTRSNVPRSMITRRLIEQLAAHLASDAIQTTEEAYSVTHRLRVYVMSPEQFERAVQRRAERLHPGMPDPRWIDGGKDD
jgi:hypothetical protein